MSMSTTQRILIVSHYYPPHIGGIEIVAYNEATRLASLGNHVTVVTSKTHSDPASGIYEGVNVIRIPVFNGLEARGIPFPLFSPMLLLRLWRAIRQADIVHIHDVFYMSSFCAALAARIQKRPTIITQHVAMVSHPSKLTTTIERMVYNTTGKWSLHHSSRIITINSRVKQFLTDLGIDSQKIVAMSNGVDMQLFHKPTAKEKAAARKAFGLPPHGFIVLFIGRFVPKKGFNAMVEAAGADYLTIFAGGDTDLQSDGNRRFIGRVTQARLAKLYQTADLFVLPSESEGFPLTAQEAMASGVPVVLKYDTGYERYKLTAAHIAYLEQAGVDELKHAIANLREDVVRRQGMAKHALQYARDNFSWDSHVAALRELHTIVLSERGEDA